MKPYIHYSLSMSWRLFIENVPLFILSFYQHLPNVFDRVNVSAVARPVQQPQSLPLNEFLNFLGRAAQCTILLEGDVCSPTTKPFANLWQQSHFRHLLVLVLPHRPFDNVCSRPTPCTEMAFHTMTDCGCLTCWTMLSLCSCSPTLHHSHGHDECGRPGCAD